MKKLFDFEEKIQDSNTEGPPKVWTKNRVE